MRCFKKAKVRVGWCGVGGLGVGSDLASIAVSVQESAECSLDHSAVEKVPRDVPLPADVPASCARLQEVCVVLHAI